jgi:predicted dienelactone hydrolase
MRRRSGRRAAIAGATLVVACVVASCGSGSNGTSTSASTASTVAPTGRPPPRPFAVGTLVRTLVDASRPTAAQGGAPGQPSRALVTTMLYPALGQPGPVARPNAPPDTAAGPFPLVVFAPGSGGAPADFGALLGSWAQAGYVVAAPEFPLTGAHAPGGSVVADYVNQPGDVRFVIDQLLRAPPVELAGLVDGGRVGLAGYSLGGVTAMGVAFNSCCLDPRVKAVVVMAGSPLPFAGGTYFGPVASPPALFIQGSADQTVVPDTSVLSYNRARPPKSLVTIVGGTHSSPYQGDQLTPQVELVAQVAVDFLDRYLEGRPAGAAQLRQAVASSGGLATLRESGL